MGLLHFLSSRINPSYTYCKINVFRILISIPEPDGFPQNVSGQSSSSKSILVMWDEVPANQQNGIITGYTITYQSQTQNDNGYVQVKGSVRQTQLTNLKEYVNYGITVLASTVKGDGPASVPIVVRTDQDSKYTAFFLPSSFPLQRIFYASINFSGVH